MLFITLLKLPSFLHWPSGVLPRLKPRKIPVREWLLQVLVFASGSLLNNLVYAYDVPLTVQIVFRSAGEIPSFELRILGLNDSHGRSGCVDGIWTPHPWTALHRKTICAPVLPVIFPFRFKKYNFW
jgi:hypothetical protein